MSQPPNTSSAAPLEARRLLQSEFGYYGTYGQACYRLVSEELYRPNGIVPDEYIEQIQGDIGFGAFSGTRLVGVAALVRSINPDRRVFDSEAPFLHYLAIARDLQHTESRVGKALLAACETYVVQCGKSELRLRAIRDSSVFYQKHGYHITPKASTVRGAPYMQRNLLQPAAS